MTKIRFSRIMARTACLATLLLIFMSLPAAAVETVRKGGRGLYGLINNAGVFTGGPLIETDIGERQRG